jgi:hypothetical protein
MAVLAGMMLHAQELLPELATPAAKYKAAIEMLDKQRLETVAKASQSYVNALDSIEKAATAKNEIATVAATVKEREAAVAGTLEPDFPTTLPKAKLQTGRKSLLASLERIGKDFATRRKLADGDYLRTLATLQAKAAANPELAKQIAAEKTALLGGGSAAGTGVAPMGKNAVVNGDFGKRVDGKPEGWWCYNKMLMVEENSNTFVRFEEKTANKEGAATEGVVRQTLDCNKDAKTVTVSARVRINNITGPRKPAAMVMFKDQDEKLIASVYASYEGRSGSWTKIQKTGPVPKGAVTTYVQVTNNKCIGQIDFDDVEVTFK